jgi:hypothetical protein
VLCSTMLLRLKLPPNHSVRWPLNGSTVGSGVVSPDRGTA